MLNQNELSALIAKLLGDAPPRPAIKKNRAPVWVPHNGAYYVITCTDCLRSFSIPAEENDQAVRELRTLECIHCEALVKFIIEENFRLIPARTGPPLPETRHSARADLLARNSIVQDDVQQGTVNLHRAGAAR